MAEFRLMRLFICTINYNSAEYTIKLLESLRVQTDNDFYVEVLDNASESDNELRLNNYIKNSWPEAIYIRKKKNLGFAGGTNAQILDALHRGADWIVMLNNDAWVDPDFISKLKNILNNQEPAIFGLPINEGEKTVYGGKIKWLKEPSLSMHIARRGDALRGPQSGQFLEEHLGKKGGRTPTVYIIGGAMVIHKDVFNQIGFFDEAYFLYYEDADFCFRAAKSGITVSYLEEPTVYHSVSASTRSLGSPRLLYYHYRNVLYFNRKNGSLIIKVLVWPWSLFIFGKQILKVILGVQRAKSRAILHGVIDFWRDKMGKYD